jgi:molybdenum cofactor synthesis domain-containing protein
VIPLAEARAYVMEMCPPRVPRWTAVGEALGLVAAQAVEATEPVPPFVNSSRDGYALRSGDTEPSGAGPVRLRVVGTVLAGSTYQGSIHPGQAVRIMTGAPLPAGADAVSMIEDVSVESDGEVVVIDRPVEAGTAVRHPGEDVAVGEVLIDAGTELTPAHLGVLVNQALTDVLVHPRPRVGVLSTGDELVAGPGPLRPGQIRDANRPMLLAQVAREGWQPVDLGMVGDDEDALGTALSQAAGTCDAIVTTGGVSVGDLDMVKVVLEKLSHGAMRWMQVAIRPAKPFAFGRLAASGTPTFGLPGNPVSALVSFELFVRPAVRQMAGHRNLDRAVVPARADAPFPRRLDGKTHFVRSEISLHADGTWGARPVAGQDSHQLRAMADANGLVILPDGPGVPMGGVVSVLLTEPDRLVAPPAPASAGHR